MAQHPSVMDNLWRRPVRVYAGVVAVVTAMIIMAYHAHAAWHVAWVFPVALVAGMVLVLWLRDATMPFLLLVIAVPLEAVRVATVGGMDVRLFHVCAIVCGMWMLWRVVRHGVGHTWQQLRQRWTVVDMLMVLFMSGACAMVFVAEDWYAALLQTMVLVSCAGLYLLARVFVRSVVEAARVVPLVVAGGAVVSVYAIVQNIFFHSGMPSMEVMPGRPNALLSEPDWLGMYLVIVLAMAVVQLYAFSERTQVAWWKKGVHYGMMTVIVTALVITMARSAWLGAAAVLGLYALALAMRGAWDVMARHIVVGMGVAVCAAGVIMFGGLTDFALFDRVSSTGTGQQEITVSCGDAARAEQLMRVGLVAHVDDLASYGCRHIRVEEVTQEDTDGNSVIRIKRADPNITMRKNIYAATYNAITEKPWTGYGWGASATFLGADEQGTPLNTSNIFLEVAFSIGVVGAVLYGLMIGAVAVYGALRWLRHTSDTAADTSRRIAGLAALLGVCAIVVPNIFNAGIFLAIVWLIFGVIAVIAQKPVTAVREVGAQSQKMCYNGREITNRRIV